ncbi:hypothetical protein HYS94_01750 [Candidatus Daviesbacteria bacterium]|nr:hypothetical protein [Candidatus Daviesbacteria bacterium]
MSKKNDSIEELLKNGLMKYGSDKSLLFDRVAFGIESLDKLVGGGIPKKRMSLFTGPPSSGKSYLASQAVVSEQKNGGVAAWIDTELSWDPVWMERCGVDIDKIYLVQPTTGEEAFDTIKVLMNEKVGVIVLDSIAGIVPTAVQEEDFSYNPVAWQARFVNQSIPKLFPSLKNGSALIVINQVRSSLGPVSLDNMPGGVAQQFFAHFILQIRREGWIEDADKNKMGFDIKISCKKSKVGGQPYQSCTVPFRLEGGIDLLETVIREALDKGIIEQARAWFKWGDLKVIGMKGVKEYLINNPDKKLELESLIKE